MNHLTDPKLKVAVITGASSGIGEACAEAFARNGYNVVLSGRNAERLDHVRKSCETIGAEVLAVISDVSREEDCKRLADEAVRRFGRIDVLVNNAGIGMRALFSELHLDVLKQLMDTNFWGTVYCTRYMIAELLKHQGSVIGVSSVAGIKGLPGRTGYSASKFAMRGFLESLRIENLRTGLHVGIISPGYTASNIRNTALNKDGNAQQESPFDENKLMPASQVADEIVRMVAQRRAESVLTLQGKLTDRLNRFFPRWVDKLVYRTVAKEKDSPFK